MYKLEDIKDLTGKEYEDNSLLTRLAWVNVCLAHMEDEPEEK
jgi:hypothetical protein